MQLNDVHLGGVDLNALVALDALLLERSVTRAAKRVGLSPSAMSHTLRRLRALFDDSLLVRGQGGMLPTPLAQELAVPLRRGLLELQRALDRELSFDPRTAARTLHIACSDYIQAVLLPGLLALLAEEAPGLDVCAHPVPRNIRTELETGNIDLVIGPCLSDAGSELVRRQLFTEDFACAVRRDHPQVGEALDLATYTDLRHALFSPRGEGAARVDVELQKLGSKRRVVLRVPHLLTAVLMIAHTDMVLTAPRRVVVSLAAFSPIRVLEPPLSLPGFVVDAIWHERVQRDPAHVWLRGVLARVAGATETRLNPS